MELRENNFHKKTIMKNLLVILMLFIFSKKIEAQQKEISTKTSVANTIYSQFKEFHNRLYSEQYTDFDEQSFVEWGYSNGFYYGRNMNGFRDGIGTYYFIDSGTRYFGGWQKDEKEGYAVNINPTSLFTGYYKNNKKNGFGITQWLVDKPLKQDGFKDIIKYVGMYKNSKRNGYGVLYFKDGSYLSGIWENSTLKTALSKIEVLENLGF